MKINQLIPFLIITALVIYFSTFSGCTKEYSSEGHFVRDTTTRDTTLAKDTPKIDSTINFPFCLNCNSNSTYIQNKWSFRNYQSVICGNIYTARIDSAYLDRGYDITIRGFQECVRDTLFVITGIFPAHTFDADRTNVIASSSNFLLYAPNNSILAVTSITPLTMNMVLDTFNYATGIATINFFGYAYTNKGGSSYVTGDSTYISDGRIKVKIR
jgi:hypothetical protein